ncbi:speedy protein E4-like isoform X2 [Vombatus ursinus]|uniref:speedy protein E4-like isoform X2 n=1 Tax=Vombatus ursinus TaxID=29139 RepID=UPI000FFD7FEE|nr:speedy protein E4-like isoform X2 [Vombatus ursinus]
MEAGPRISASKWVARKNRPGPDSEGKRGKKRKKYGWKVTEVHGTLIKMKRIRMAGCSSGDHAVFNELQTDPVIEGSLDTNVGYHSSDETLLTMMVECFGHLEFLRECNNMVHFLLALYIASQMDTLDMSYDWLILSALLESNWYADSFRKLWPLQIGFLNAIDRRAQVSRESSGEPGNPRRGQ